MKPGNLIRSLSIMAALIGAHAQAQAAATVQVQEAWRTPAELQQPESVVFDPKRNVLYVSNVSGEPLSKDGQVSFPRYRWTERSSNSAGSRA